MRASPTGLRQKQFQDRTVVALIRNYQFYTICFYCLKMGKPQCQIRPKSGGNCSTVKHLMDAFMH